SYVKPVLCTPESQETALPATEVVLWLSVCQTQWTVSPTWIVTGSGLNAKLMIPTVTVARSARGSRASTMVRRSSRFGRRRSPYKLGTQFIIAPPARSSRTLTQGAHPFIPPINYRTCQYQDPAFFRARADPAPSIDDVRDGSLGLSPSRTAADLGGNPSG